MSCSLPQSEASGGASLRRSRRLTEVGVTRGCLFGSSHLFQQFTHRHDGLHHSFFGGNDFFGGDCSARSNIAKSGEKVKHCELHTSRRPSSTASSPWPRRSFMPGPRDYAPLGLRSTRPVVPSRFHLPWG